MPEERKEEPGTGKEPVWIERVLTPLPPNQGVREFGMKRWKDFDFYQHVWEILRKRTTSGFIPYHEVYSYLGRRFCLKKREVKDLIKSMGGRGYLTMKKRGILLIER